ncbi:hypothetical protein [Rhodoferax sp.]|uniref:hypothetical protein n=1 Tax=Rhodoferax sp. TaxID=50421 RepID=UPI00261D95E6|nr:hypothetical protein [Rhodoferax sp.]MDD2923814.1 hypothetical protein [Rhodoferax sp.]
MPESDAVSELQNLLTRDDALNDSQLDGVAGGAQPTAVNQQITDAVARANAKNPNAPPIAAPDMFKFFNSHRNPG